MSSIGPWFMCPRCGCVGFHSEACITAIAAERATAARGEGHLAYLESIRAEERQRVLGELRERVEALPHMAGGPCRDLSLCDCSYRSQYLAIIDELEGSE